MNKFGFAAASLAACISIGITFAAAQDEQSVATYTFTNGTTCVNCIVTQRDWGLMLYKSPTIKGYYERLLRQAAAGGEHLTLEKPDKTVLKVTTHRIKTEEISPEAHANYYNLSTFDGQRYKNIHKVLTDYQERYFIFATDSDERLTIPFQTVEYLVDAKSGKLLFNGAEVKAKVANLIEQENQANALALVLQRNMATQAMLQQQKLQTQAMMMQAIKPAPVTQPTTINCNTLGSNTTCTGW